MRPAGDCPSSPAPAPGPPTPYPVTELAPGQAVPFGDVPMSAIAADRGNPGAIDYLLPGNRRLP